MSRRPLGLAPGAELEGAGQDTKKYGSTNPVVRYLISRWLGRLREIIGARAGVLVDVGIGEGLALERIAPRPRMLIGIDYRADKLKVALSQLANLEVIRADAGMLPLRDRSADVVTCIEVLEHLVGHDLALSELARITRQKCIVSVPWEPYFRAGNLLRGKHVRRLGNDPEHINHFNPRTLDAALREYFPHVEVRPCFPWVTAVAQPSRG